MRVRALAIVWLIAVAPMTLAAELPDAQIRERLIRESIARYPGNCPCPYNVDRAGRRCGARSAYSKQGGYTPLCFAEDVTSEMIDAFRRQTRG